MKTLGTIITLAISSYVFCANQRDNKVEHLHDCRFSLVNYSIFASSRILDGSGTITIHELANWMARHGKVVSPLELEKES